MKRLVAKLCSFLLVKYALKGHNCVICMTDNGTVRVDALIGDHAYWLCGFELTYPQWQELATSYLEIQREKK